MKLLIREGVLCRASAHLIHCNMDFCFKSLLLSVWGSIFFSFLVYFTNNVFDFVQERSYRYYMIRSFPFVLYNHSYVLNNFLFVSYNCPFVFYKFSFVLYKFPFVLYHFPLYNYSIIFN